MYFKSPNRSVEPKRPHDVTDLFTHVGLTISMEGLSAPNCFRGSLSFRGWMLAESSFFAWLMVQFPGLLVELHGSL